jgi:hypothetical protein
MLTIIVIKEDIVNIPQKRGGTKGISLACEDIALSGFDCSLKMGFSTDTEDPVKSLGNIIGP